MWKKHLYIFFVWKMILFCFPAMFLASCVTIPKNYLETDLWPVKSTLSKAKPFSDHERAVLNKDADTLIQSIELQKRQKRYLKANAVNKLFAGFGKQLDIDRQYNSFLQERSSESDSLKAVKTYAAAQLLHSASIYEKTYQKNRVVRRTLNRGESGNRIPKRALQRSRAYLYSIAVRKEISGQNKKYYSPVTDSILKTLPKTNWLKDITCRVFQKNDRLNMAGYNFLFAAINTLGNSAGLVQGISQQKTNAEKLAPFLQPFDIILSKSPSHLTDKLIPGYFGHAAIWLGPGITNKLLSGEEKRKDRLKFGINKKSVVEAIRQGVKTSSLEEFADGEDYLILRLKNITPSQKESVIDNTRKQLGKDYDFIYDFESPETISCTELIYLGYDFVDWQIRYYGSEYYISPDDLPFTAFKNSDLKFPVFIKNDAVYENPGNPFMQKLLGVPDEMAGK
jgi:hypothetical protein